jgi:hypothetical protein
MKTRLLTTAEVQTELHHLADNNRQSVRVPRQALINLLIDHGVMCARIGEHNIIEAIDLCREGHKTSEVSP